MSVYYIQQSFCLLSFTILTFDNTQSGLLVYARMYEGVQVQLMFAVICLSSDILL